MPTTFTEFLHHQAEKHRAEAQAGKAVVDEWRAGVSRLYDQIRQWLKESDPEGIIEIKESETNVSEPGLGQYVIPRLDLRAFGKWVGIIPKARRTVGTATPPRKNAPERAIGRVDITDELRRYVLYRFKEGDGDVWLIDESLVEQPSQGFVQYTPRLELKPLNREAFERALTSYLR